MTRMKPGENSTRREQRPRVEPSRRGWARSLASYAASTWLVLAGFELFAASLLTRSTLNEPILSRAVRHGLMADELLGLALAVALIVLLGATTTSLANRLAARQHPARWLSQAAIIVIAWLLLFLYLASWLAFRSTSAFIGLDGIAFFAIHAIQFLQHVTHMEPYAFVALPMLATLGTGVLVGLFPYTVSRLTNGARKILVGAAVAAMVVCAGVSLRTDRRVAHVAAVVNDPRVGPVYTRAELYAECRDARTGPILRTLADLREARAAASTEAVDALISDKLPSLTRHEIVQMDDYIGGVEQKALVRRNVIVVLVESLRSDELKAYGAKLPVMPAVDAVAAESVVFLNHYTQSSHSNYADPCPFSSHYPLRSPRAHVYPARPSYPRVLIYDVLRELGYRTAIISSQNERWGAMLNYLRTGGLEYLFHSPSFDGPTYVPRGDSGFEAFVKGHKRSGKVDDRFTVSEAIRWLDSIGQDPFFLYLNLQSSHLPYETPADFPRRFGRGDLPFVIRFNNYPAEAAHLVRAEYRNSLAYVDFQLERLFEFLRTSGRWQSTIVVISGDTGQAFYEHGFAAHANALYDEVMRVPLIIHVPGQQARLDDRPAQHIDVAPTVLRLLGLPPHPSFQGVDLYAESLQVERSRFLVAQSPLAHQLAIVRGDFKLLSDERRRARRLFNLRRDPGETQDVHTEHPQVTEDLSVRLETWRRAQLEYYGDVGLQRRYYPPILVD